MGKLFSKQSRKRSKTKSDPMKKFNLPMHEEDRKNTANCKPLENKDSTNIWKGLVCVKNEHQGAINSLDTINPKYCISGGKDYQIVVQVTKFN